MEQNKETMEERLTQLLRNDADLNFAVDYIPDKEWNKVIDFIRAELQAERNKTLLEFRQIFSTYLSTMFREQKLIERSTVEEIINKILAPSHTGENK